MILIESHGLMSDPYESHGLALRDIRLYKNWKVLSMKALRVHVLNKLHISMHAARLTKSCHKMR